MIVIHRDIIILIIGDVTMVVVRDVIILIISNVVIVVVSEVIIAIEVIIVILFAFVVIDNKWSLYIVLEAAQIARGNRLLTFTIAHAACQT
jgi:hypothetical protein